VKPLVHSLVLLAVCLPTARAQGPLPRAKPDTAAPPAEIQIDDNAGRVVGLDRAGRAQWSTRLKGHLGSVRPPDLIVDRQRVYLAHWPSGVTALDRHTGEVRWHSSGPCERLHLSAGLLLAVNCERKPRHGRWLVARAADCGAEEFRVQLPLKDFDPDPIQEVAGLFVVQSSWSRRTKDAALLIDRRGKVRHRLDRPVLDGRRYGPDLILLTSTDMIRLTPDGRQRWSVPFGRQVSCPGGQLLQVADGDLLGSLFGGISDSGVQVIRLNPDTGNAVWKTRCPRLGTSHSAYRHDATLKPDADQVVVTSRGSHGTFVEVLDLKSGGRVRRDVQER
jgi:outer membrane protein assembly factor BamB